MARASFSMRRAGALRRSTLLVLPLAGLSLSLYLTLYQCGVIASVWDPLFDSPKVLELTHPVPDAAAGVAAYAGETILWFAARRTWALLALGALFLAGAVTSVVLIAVQALVAQAWCLLCLASAAISLVLFGVGMREGREGLQRLRDKRARGLPLRSALLSTG